MTNEPEVVDEAFEARLRGALAVEAERAVATPALYDGVEHRLGVRRRRTVLAVVGVTAAAVLGAAIAIPALIGSDESTPQIVDQPEDIGPVAGSDLPVGYVVASGPRGEVRVLGGDGVELFPGTSCGPCVPLHDLAVHPSSTASEVTWVSLSQAVSDPNQLTIESTTISAEQGSGSAAAAADSAVDPGDFSGPLDSAPPPGDRPLERPGIVFSPDGDQLAWSAWDGVTTSLVVSPWEGVPQFDNAVRLPVDLDGMWRLTGWAWDRQYDDGRTGLLSFASLGASAVVTVAQPTGGELVVLDTEMATMESFGFSLGGWPGAVGAAMLMPWGEGLILAHALDWQSLADGAAGPVFSSGASRFPGPPDAASDDYFFWREIDIAADRATAVSLAASGGAVVVATGEDVLIATRDGVAALGQQADVARPFGAPTAAVPQIRGSIDAVINPPSMEPGADTPTTPASLLVNTGTQFWIEGVAGGGRVELGSVSPETWVDAIEPRPGSTVDDLTALLTRRGVRGWEFQRMVRVDGVVTFASMATQFQPDTATELGAPQPVFSPDGRHVAWVEGTADEVSLRTIGWIDRAPGTGRTADDNASFVLPMDLVGDQVSVRSWTWSDEATIARAQARDPAYPMQAAGTLLLVDNLGLAYEVSIERQGDGGLAVGGVRLISHVEEPPAGWVTTLLFALDHVDDIGNRWDVTMSWPPFAGVDPAGPASPEFRPYLLDAVVWGDADDGLFTELRLDGWAEGMVIATGGRGYVVTTVGSRELDGDIVDVDWLDGAAVR